MTDRFKLRYIKNFWVQQLFKETFLIKISGGKEGAMTSAQGQGGTAKSQSQISVDAKTGGTSATSQSGGEKHESQSEVVANEKGGLADAQASGPGQTSSQAQIGFRPQEEDSQESVYNVFNGGGKCLCYSLWNHKNNFKLFKNFRHSVRSIRRSYWPKSGSNKWQIQVFF